MVTRLVMVMMSQLIQMLNPCCRPETNTYCISITSQLKKEVTFKAQNHFISTDFTYTSAVNIILICINRRAIDVSLKNLLQYSLLYKAKVVVVI